MIRFLMLLITPLLTIAPLASATPVQRGAVEAELIAETDTAAAGKSVIAAIRLKTAPHWHVYWENPGDSGTPVKVGWTLPDGVTAGGLGFPVPSEFDTAGFVTYGHEGEVFLLTELNVAPGIATGADLPIKATVSWLACDPSRCVPGRAELAMSLKVTAGEPKPNRWTKQVAQAKAALPRKVKDAKISAAVAGSKVTILVNVDSTVRLPFPATGAFFPIQPGVFQLGHPKPVVSAVKAGEVSIVLELAGDAELPKTIRGVLAIKDAPSLLIEASR